MTCTIKQFYNKLTVAGPVEADPEYQLIVEANNLTVEIDNEISRFLKIILYVQRLGSDILVV